MAKIYRFEGLTLDLHRGCLTSADGDKVLRPKSFEVLLHLVENAGRLVSKEELVSVIWPRVNVNEDSLARCISEVRLAIGDHQHRIIKTLPRRGYRFGASVESHNELQPTDSATATSPPATDNPSAIDRLSAAIVDHSRPGATPGDRFRPPSNQASIAVLHFAKNSSDPAQDYLAEGLSEDLITGLSKFSDLFIIARHSAFGIKDQGYDAARVGHELGVRYLLSGSVRRDGERVRVTARLVDAVTNRELWAQAYDRLFTSIFGLQDDLTQKIVGTLLVHLKQSELVRSRRKAVGNLAAYDYYLRGNALLKNRAGVERGRMVAEARHLLQQAVDSDPHYAPAVQALAEAYLVIWLERTGYAPLDPELRHSETLGRARARRAGPAARSTSCRSACDACMDLALAIPASRSIGRIREGARTQSQSR